MIQNATRKRHRAVAGKHSGVGTPRQPGGEVGELLRDILAAYHERGGISWLLRLSDADFLRLLHRAMPAEITPEMIKGRQPTIIEIVRAVPPRAASPADSAIEVSPAE